MTVNTLVVYLLKESLPVCFSLNCRICHLILFTYCNENQMGTLAMEMKNSSFLHL